MANKHSTYLLPLIFKLRSPTVSGAIKSVAVYVDSFKNNILFPVFYYSYSGFYSVKPFLLIIPNNNCILVEFSHRTIIQGVKSPSMTQNIMASKNSANSVIIDLVKTSVSITSINTPSSYYNQRAFPNKKISSFSVKHATRNHSMKSFPPVNNFTIISILGRSMTAYHFVTKRNKVFTISIRTMRSTSNFVSKAAQVAMPKSPSAIFTRPYANYEYNQPDNASPDSKALTNNPPIAKAGMRHNEIHRVRCDMPGCTGRVCIGLCGNATDRKAVAHATHGQPPAHETDKTTIPVTNEMKGKDFEGKTKPQKLVFYKDAHTVNQTPTIGQGTNEIQLNKKLQETILNNEDTK